MIIDSSAIIAITFGESGWETLLDAIEQSAQVHIPAPVITETRLVLGGRGREYLAAAEKLLMTLRERGALVLSFDQDHAELTGPARDRFGKGNSRGGLLNFGDLMVYAIAKKRGEPVLCTGRDFVSTDIDVHPASRLDP